MLSRIRNRRWNGTALGGDSEPVIVAPVISEAPSLALPYPEAGQTATIVSAVYTGTEPIVPTYFWQNDDVGTIADETNSTYVVQDADIGFKINGYQTLTNDAGSAGAPTPQSLTILEKPGKSAWTLRTTSVNNSMRAVAAHGGRMVCVMISGSGTRVATSDNGGQSWTTRTSAANNSWWTVKWVGGTTWVALATTGTGTRCMRSTDNGNTWSLSGTIADQQWRDMDYDPVADLCIAVSSDGTNQVALSTDKGVTWSYVAMPIVRGWWRVRACGSGKWAAIHSSGSGDTEGAAYSTNSGSSWTSATTPGNSWSGLCKTVTGRLVATATDGSNRAMTSDDQGATWTQRTTSVANSWGAVAASDQVVIAVSYDGSGDRAMISLDDGETWTGQTTPTSPTDNSWRDICFDDTNRNFAAVANSGTLNRCMTNP
jgi:hypothetical protein